MVKHYECVVCKRRVKPAGRRPIPDKTKKLLRKILCVQPCDDDVICPACRTKLYRSRQKKCKETEYTEDIPVSVPQPSTSQLISPPSVVLKIPSTSRSHSRCFVCKRSGPKLVRLGSECRLQAFLQYNIIIHSDARCCPVHVSEKTLKIDSVENIDNLNTSSYLNRSSISTLLQSMRSLCIQQNSSLNFDSLPEADYSSLTGLSKTQFNDLFSHINDKIKSTPSRSPKTTVGLFLLKLRSGISNRLLSTIFSLSKSSVRRAVATVREALMRSFVPLYLGFENVTRKSILCNHTRQLAKSLFCSSSDRIVLVLDGTYIYINKSNNYKFQRRTYSLHKGRPLVKPMVIVTTTGHFVNIIGPYLADGKNNDAAILNHILKSNIDDVKDFLEEGDVLVVDRGFRDSLELLEDLGIHAKMPALLTKGQKQLQTDDANESRLVTKIRWVVESANARIKRFKYLDNVMPNSQIPFIGDFVRIVCSISNKYFPPLSSADQLESDAEMAAKMIMLLERENKLQKRIEETGLDRKRTVWKDIDEEHIYFPVMNSDQLSELTLGVYQLNLSPSYIQEHLEGEYDIKVNTDDQNLLCVKMQSRHTSSKQHMLWIEVENSAVHGWYCTCRCGSRVIGMCAHIAAIVWYLSNGRHSRRNSYGVRDWSTHLSDAAEFQIDENETSGTETD